jgi:phosphate:Na+ symporter
LQRLIERCGQRDRIATLHDEAHLRRDVATLATALGRDSKAPRLERLARLIAARTARFRRGVLLREHAGLLPVSEVFARTDALRWLGRVADHAARLSRHAEEAKRID